VSPENDSPQWDKKSRNIPF